MKTVLIGTLLVIICIANVQGHGMLVDPAGRGSRWRYDKTAPINYNDNANFCGGGAIPKVNGYCGLCGDSPRAPTPRPHELNGTYGQGVIVKEYISQHFVEISVQITANHLGHFEFEICNLDKYGEESETCFGENQLDVIEGGKKHYIGSKGNLLPTTVVIPIDLKCNHCVLRWIYRGGNNWGVCEDGSGAVGCGAQETFVNCADIKIQ